MKRCAFWVSVAGLICLLTPSAAGAATPQVRHQSTPYHPSHVAAAAVRKAPKLPRRDQVHRTNIDGNITFIQLISTRRLNERRQGLRVAPPDSVAQVRASREGAERGSPATLLTRSVDSWPRHWGATHLSI